MDFTRRVIKVERKLRCPGIGKWRRPPQPDELIDERCWECPALMREVNERGLVSLYCLVFRNRLRAAKRGVYATAGTHTVTAWRWQKHEEHATKEDDRESTLGRG
jgi:hypothetical protein